MSRLKVPTPPSPFPPVNVLLMVAGTPLHRMHSRSLHPAEFNPCLGQPSRFAPFHTAKGGCVPSLYAATTRQAAAFETIFHDIAPKARFKTVMLSSVDSRAVSEIAPHRDLKLVQLFTPDLKASRVPRSRLIDTPKSTYDETVAWAKAIHAAHAHVDGLAWTSRQCDPDVCLVLFGDRVDEGELDVLANRQVATDPRLLLELRTYGRRAGITIVS